MTTPARPRRPDDLLLPDDLVLRDGDDLLLRRHRRSDLAGIVAQCVDPATVRFTVVPTPYGPDEAEEFLTACERTWEEGTAASFAVVVDGGFAGTVDLRLDGTGWAEVGFGLGPWARGRGTAARAVRTVLRWAFADLGLAGVHWRADVENWGSRRTAWRCGFRVEGRVRGLLVQRGTRRDGWIGSVLRGEPLAPAEPWEGPER
ncbi:GNAT family N-acetyltransferase [Kineococcus sp. R8]|uniref:GNAT family N-acetyltransferase n=1 Tax=Kineococcus siccus TaxID=2696567 RepID=UPI0014122032|nr:GNAT family N-acetyltransferase [Kineococcus siccus]